MEIRFAEMQDVAGILALLKQVGQVHHRGRPDLFRDNAQKYGASQVIAMLNHPSAPIFVAVEDGRVLGYGFCQTHRHENDPVLTDVTSLYIDDLCVDEKCRGKGIGKQFFDFITAKYAGCLFRLEVEEENERAVKLYRQSGFTVLPYMEMKK